MTVETELTGVTGLMGQMRDLIGIVSLIGVFELIAMIELISVTERNDNILKPKEMIALTRMAEGTDKSDGLHTNY